MLRDTKPDNQVDPYIHFSARHGKRTYGPGQQQSQIVLGTDTTSMRAAEESRRQERAPLALRSVNHIHSTLTGTKLDGRGSVPPTRRPRGPGTAYAERIEREGFPTHGGQRTSRVANETNYQYETDVLHTHRRMAAPTQHMNRANINLFEYQAAPLALASKVNYAEVSLDARRYPAAQLIRQPSPDPRVPQPWERATPYAVPPQL